MSALLLNLLLSGCGDEPDPVDSDEADADTDTDADSDTDSDTDTDTGAGWASLSGMITDTSGAPLTNVRVQVCVEGNCRYDEVDESGYYELIEALEPDPASHAFDVVVKDAGYSIPLVPIWFEHGEVREIDVSVPAAGDEVAIPETAAEDLDLGEGVHVTLSQADLDAPFGVDKTVGSSVRPDQDIWPPIERLDGEVVAVWYLSPFDTSSLSGGFDFWIEASAVGAGEGDSYEAWVVDYEHADWAAAGTMSVDGDKLVSDSQMPILSTLVLTK